MNNKADLIEFGQLVPAFVIKLHFGASHVFRTAVLLLPPRGKNYKSPHGTRDSFINLIGPLPSRQL